MTTLLSTVLFPVRFTVFFGVPAIGFAFRGAKGVGHGFATFGRTLFIPGLLVVGYANLVRKAVYSATVSGFIGAMSFARRGMQQVALQAELAKAAYA